MKSKHLLSLTAVAAVAALGIAPAASAATVTTAAPQGSAYEVAVAAPATDVLEADPQAIPAVVAGARVSWMAFKAAKAPQQAGQVLRAASFLQNFMGGSSVKHLDTHTGANIDVIFDH